MGSFPKIFKIKKIIKNNECVKTYFIDGKIDAQPGQFFMLWLPGVDEKPYGFSYLGKETGFSVHLRGEFTREFFKLKKGDKIGIRGPFGNGFEIKGKKVCVVGGGIGNAPLSPLVEVLKKEKKSVDVIFGAKCKEEVLFFNRFPHANLCTDDGCIGEKGYTTDVFESLLKVKKYDCVYTCGPEAMIVKAFELCEKHKIECQALLERYMKCGIGICDQCSIDGFMVCKDGPVFNPTQMRKMTELGKFARVKSGRKVRIEEYIK